MKSHDKVRAEDHDKFKEMKGQGEREKGEGHDYSCANVTVWQMSTMVPIRAKPAFQPLSEMGGKTDFGLGRWI